MAENSKKRSRKGVEWENHKYIDKVKTKTGRIRYVYDDKDSGESYNLVQTPDGQHYYIFKHNKRFKINVQDAKDQAFLAKKGTEIGVNNFKKAVQDKDVGKAADAATFTVGNVAKSLGMSVAALAGPAVNTVTEGMGLVQDMGSILTTGMDIVDIPESYVEHYLATGEFHK